MQDFVVELGHITKGTLSIRIDYFSIKQKFKKKKIILVYCGLFILRRDYNPGSLQDNLYVGLRATLSFENLRWL